MLEVNLVYPELVEGAETWSWMTDPHLIYFCGHEHPNDRNPSLDCSLSARHSLTKAKAAIPLWREPLRKNP